MSDKILLALMQLFAIVANSDEVHSKAREIVRRFLERQLSRNYFVRYLNHFDDFLDKLQGKSEEGKERKRISVNSVKVLRICNDINQELDQKRKVIVFIHLIEFVHSLTSGNESEQHADFIKTVADVFSISEEDQKNCYQLVTQPASSHEWLNKSFLIVSNHKHNGEASHHINRESFHGELIFLFFRHLNFLVFKKIGSDQVFLNGKALDAHTVSVLEPGSVIRGQKIHPVYYYDIIRFFMHESAERKVEYQVIELAHQFRNNKPAIHELSFSASSGNLVGVMGNSGAGKTTLLNLLNGSVTPASGKVLINNTELHSNKKQLTGLIGNIPQDDLLVEELSVFQNLYYSSKLYFGKLSDEEIKKRVDNCLDVLGLSAIKDLPVGDPLNKFISGGQRKRLNIALELIREPEILFVDEPTSGLSSNDAENVMDLLKQLSLSGKLIFVVIHQPSSDIYKLFDQLLLLDTGGYPVYFGHPVEALSYVKKHIGFVNFEENECDECGNINPDEIFKITETKTIDEFGRATSERKISSADWFKLFKENQPVTTETNSAIKISDAPKVSGKFTQYLIYLKRNLFAKLRNKQYVAITMVEAPLLAVILAVATRSYLPGGTYTFGGNNNIPVYIFISTIVALFLGLIVSAEEIIQDKKILKREAFLQLSRRSYLLSKISYIILISAIQSFLFLLVGNLILGVRELFFHYWLILFATSCFAGLLGLNISSGLKTRVAVYILIPFLIIPQIMLSGAMVKFEELSPMVSSQSKVPLVGNLMTSRWAYEALAVDQFRNNSFEKPFFEFEKRMSNATYRKDWWGNVMENSIYFSEQDVASHKVSSDSLEKMNEFFISEFSDLKKEYPAMHMKDISKMTIAHDGEKFFSVCKENLDTMKKFLIATYNDASEKKEALMESLMSKFTSTEEYTMMKQKYFNDKLDEVVKNSLVKDKTVIDENKIIRRFQPVFVESKSTGIYSAPFYSYSKSFFGIQLETFWFNLLMIVIMTVILYLTLYYDLLRKALEW